MLWGKYLDPCLDQPIYLSVLVCHAQRRQGPVGPDETGSCTYLFLELPVVSYPQSYTNHNTTTLIQKDADQIMDALKSASAMLAELRTSSLTPVGVQNVCRSLNAP